MTASLVMSMGAGKAPVQLRLTNGDRLGGPSYRDPMPLVDYLTEVNRTLTGRSTPSWCCCAGTGAAPPWWWSPAGSTPTTCPMIAALRRRFDRVIVAVDREPAGADPGPPRVDHRVGRLRRRAGADVEHGGGEVSERLGARRPSSTSSTPRPYQPPWSSPPSWPPARGCGPSRCRDDGAARTGGDRVGIDPGARDPGLAPAAGGLLRGVRPRSGRVVIGARPACTPGPFGTACWTDRTGCSPRPFRSPAAGPGWPLPWC